LRHSSHGSATSKGAAAGRKEKMKANKAAAIGKSPQAVYSKNKRKAAVRTPDGSQESSSGNTISDNSGSGNGGSESSDGSPPPVMRRERVRHHLNKKLPSPAKEKLLKRTHLHQQILTRIRTGVPKEEKDYLSVGLRLSMKALSVKAFLL